MVALENLLPPPALWRVAAVSSFPRDVWCAAAEGGTGQPLSSCPLSADAGAWWGGGWVGSAGWRGQYRRNFWNVPYLSEVAPRCFMLQEVPGARSVLFCHVTRCALSVPFILNYCRTCIRVPLMLYFPRIFSLSLLSLRSSPVPCPQRVRLFPRMVHSPPFALSIRFWRRAPATVGQSHL